MTHKSIIRCDRCQNEESVQGLPYPEGWGMVNTSTWSPNDFGKGVQTKFNLDLCPGCFIEINEFLIKSA